jgi:hypothetical protein
MTEHPLEHVWAKVERPRHQIQELEKSIKIFFDQNHHEIIREIDPDGSTEIWKFRLTKRLPYAFAIIIGEILHNLRSSLDQLICAIAVQYTGSSKGTYFPFGKTSEIFESELTKKAKKLPANAQDMIRAMAPYEGGSDLLWALHDLNRSDKHARSVTTALRGLVNVHQIMLFGPHGNPNPPRILTIGPRSGRHMRIGGRGEFVQEDPDRKPRKIPNGPVMFDGNTHSLVDYSMEFMTTEPGADVYTDFQPAFDLVFRDVQGLEGEPVIASLQRMHILTESIVLAFGSRFFL